MATTRLMNTSMARILLRVSRCSALRGFGTTSTPIISDTVDTRLQSDHVKAVFRSMAMQDDEIRNDLSYSLAFADNNDDEGSAWQLAVMSDPRMRGQLEKSRNQCIVPNHPTKDRRVDDEPLPRNLSDALRPSRRAIVITENKAPFRIWNVNTAWEELCGYSFLESRGKTLGTLLQGKETNTIAATNLIAKLLQGEDEAGTTLVNYRKDGRRFNNRVRVGPIYDDMHNVTHFIGVLQEVKA